MEPATDINVFAMFLPIILITVLIVPIWWRIASKAGYPGWWSLAVFLPIVNIVLLVTFAIVEWPIQKRLRELQ